ncbi:MAG: hypothetical protein IKT80_08685 [Bacteroidaceae bacterium]|nr:hypothetical protein [Bacteroidaceae bacterium]
MNRLIFSASLITLLITSCKDNTYKTLDAVKYEKLLQQTVLVIPDSLLTEDQRQFIKELENFIYDNAYVKDNLLLLSVGRDAFKSACIPEYYYDIILYQFNEVNDFVNKPHPEYPDYSFNLDSLFKKSKVK